MCVGPLKQRGERLAVYGSKLIEFNNIAWLGKYSHIYYNIIANNQATSKTGPRLSTLDSTPRVAVPTLLLYYLDFVTNSIKINSVNWVPSAKASIE